MNEEEKKITGEIDISKTIESNIDYWRNKCFEQQKEIEKIKDELKEERNFNKSALETLKECVHKDKIKEKIDLLKDIKKANCYKQLTEDYLKGAIEQLEELLGE